MQRRAFLHLLCSGLGVVVAATPATALIAGQSKLPLQLNRNQQPHPSVATPEDLDSTKVEDVRYGHWRRVNRRHYRRVSRRVYRRHYYY